MHSESIALGELDPQTIFTSVGHALSQWELMEWTLAELHSILTGKPGDMSIYAGYGREGRIFAKRKSEVEKAACKYFVRNCSQSLEGSLQALLDRAEELSIHRNQIAHGVIMNIPNSKIVDDENWIDCEDRYYLGAPWYAEERLKTGFPGFTGDQINDIAERFSTLKRDMLSFCNIILPSSFL